MADATGAVTASGTAEPGATIEVTFPDGTIGLTTAAPDGTYSVTSGPNQPTGDVNTVATDAAGNSSDASQPYADATAPDAPGVNPFTVADDGAITASGTAEPGATVTVTFPDGTTQTTTAAADGTYSVTSGPNQPTGAVQTMVADSSGNASAVVAQSLDATPPSVVISGGPDTLSDTDPFTLTITFSEDVTGFDDLADDFVIANGSVTSITGGPSVYTISVTPAGNGNVSLTIPTGAAQDASGNDNAASDAFLVLSEIVQLAREQIAGFMLNRANLLASNQPRITGFLQGERCGPIELNATEGSRSLNGCVTNNNVWASITGSWSDDSTYALGTIGAHELINPNLLVGGMVQFDYFEDDVNNASGQGWMVGPYFVAQMTDQDLFFEGRLFYGQSDNDIAPLGTFTDSFDTERWLGQLRVTGEYLHNETVYKPLLDLTYTDDTQQTYTDTLGNVVPGQTVSLLQATAGVDFNTPIAVEDGTLMLNGGVSGIYSDTNGEEADFSGLRARVDLGVDYEFDDASTLIVEGFYDGIGSDFDGYGLSLVFRTEF